MPLKTGIETGIFISDLVRYKNLKIEMGPDNDIRIEGGDIEQLDLADIMLLFSKAGEC